MVEFFLVVHTNNESAFAPVDETMEASNMSFCLGKENRIKIKIRTIDVGSAMTTNAIYDHFATIATFTLAAVVVLDCGTVRTGRIPWTAADFRMMCTFAFLSFSIRILLQSHLGCVAIFQPWWFGWCAFPDILHPSVRLWHMFNRFSMWMLCIRHLLTICRWQVCILSWWRVSERFGFSSFLLFIRRSKFSFRFPFDIDERRRSLEIRLAASRGAVSAWPDAMSALDLSMKFQCFDIPYSRQWFSWLGHWKACVSVWWDDCFWNTIYLVIHLWLQLDSNSFTCIGSLPACSQVIHP